jgi:hypothetical protein
LNCSLFRIVCFDSGLDDEQMNNNDEGEVKGIIDHPSMKTVYAITHDPNKRKFDLKNILFINKSLFQ